MDINRACSGCIRLPCSCDWIGGILLINGVLGLFYRSRLLNSLEAIRAVGFEIGILRQGMTLLQRQKFLLQEEMALACKGLGHPLLPIATCVRNDISFNEATRFYVISGSNMAGKSTLLRAIGLNAVLAYAGAPVCADGMALSLFSICASIAIQDSLLNGKSKFVAEVDRLKQALTMPADRHPVLFLIDELLSGTNSKDRRIAAEVILAALIRRGAVGALSTHDLALTELAILPD